MSFLLTVPHLAPTLSSGPAQRESRERAESLLLWAPCQAVTLCLTEPFCLPALTDSTRSADRERRENKLKVTEVGAPMLRSQSGTLQGLHGPAALGSAGKDSPGESLSRNNEVGWVGPEYLRHDSILEKHSRPRPTGMSSRFGKGLGRSSERYAWSCYMQSHCEVCTREMEAAVHADGT